MRLKVPGRNDVSLIVGSVIAILVIFQQPIQYFFRLGREIEERYGLALVPGLGILVVVLIGHFLMGRIRLAGERRRRAETTQLVGLARSLSRAATMDSVRDLLRQQLKQAVGSDRVWAVMRLGGKWEALIGGAPGTPHRASETTIALAERFLELDVTQRDAPLGCELDGHVCLPLAVEETGVGVLAAPLPTVAPEEFRRHVAALAPVLSSAIRNVQLIAQMEERGVHDGLTGCFNRTHGLKVLDAELQRAKRARTAFSVLMFDLDYFKSVNDTYGHLCGDALLTGVGKQIHTMLRNADVKIRYGGEEFLLLLPDTPVQGAIHVAQMIRQEVSRVQVQWEGQVVSTTASVGVATATPGELDAHALIGRADAALYRAKHAGRDRVCVDGRDENDVTDPGDAPHTGRSQYAAHASDAPEPARQRRAEETPAAV